MAVAHDDERNRPACGLESLGRTKAVTALGYDGADRRQGRQDAGHGLLGHVLRPIAMDGAGDLKLGVLGNTFMDTSADLVIDENTGQTTDLQELAAFRHFFGEVEHLILTHLFEVNGNAPGARFGDDAVERNNGNTGVAGFLDRAV